MAAFNQWIVGVDRTYNSTVVPTVDSTYNFTVVNYVR